MVDKGLVSQSIIFKSLSGCLQEGEAENEGDCLKCLKPNPNCLNLSKLHSDNRPNVTGHFSKSYSKGNRPTTHIGIIEMSWTFQTFESHTGKW